MTEHVDPNDAAARAAEQAARIAAIRSRRGQTPVAASEPTAAASTPASFAPPTGPALSAPAPAPAPTPTAAAPVATSARATAVSAATATTPAPRSHKVSVAAGGKILVTGLATSAVFGLTSVISAANRPTFEAQPAPVVMPSTTAVDPALTSLPLDPGVTLPVLETVPPLVAPTTVPTTQTIVLELPTLAPVNVPAGASGNTGGSGGSSAPATSAPATNTTVAAATPATTAPPVTPATPAPTTTAAPATTAPPPPPTTTAPSS